MTDENFDDLSFAQVFEKLRHPDPSQQLLDHASYVYSIADDSELEPALSNLKASKSQVLMSLAKIKARELLQENLDSGANNDTRIKNEHERMGR